MAGSPGTSFNIRNTTIEIPSTTGRASAMRLATYRPTYLSQTVLKSKFHDGGATKF